MGQELKVLWTVFLGALAVKNFFYETLYPDIWKRWKVLGCPSDEKDFVVLARIPQGISW